MRPLDAGSHTATMFFVSVGCHTTDGGRHNLPKFGFGGPNVESPGHRSTSPKMSLLPGTTEMPNLIIDMTVSLDGYVAGPDDGPGDPLGKHGGMNIFNWYFSGSTEFRDPLFKPEPGANLDEVKRMFDESGAFIFGRRTCAIGCCGAQTDEHSTANC
jgi:hypothetical protein